jgi:predicted dehydrogenase
MRDLQVIVVGLGIQGRKRQAIAGGDVAATVDPMVPEARYRSIEQVPLASFEAALVCTPDDAKLDIVRYLLSHGKHVLVEKPLLAPAPAPLQELAALARTAGVVCYTAYNHRFEPHVVALKALLDAGTLGQIYLLRGFYGNGTALDVKRSSWRDQGMGVLPDLGSHLLDLALCLTGQPEGPFEPWSFNRFENRAFDHVLFGTRSGRPMIELEATLVSWHNTFTLDVFGEQGSAHIHGLCKWGPSTLTVRRRVLPSGRPSEEVRTLQQPDPTWALEYDAFKRMCSRGETTLEHDLWINDVLQDLSRAVSSEVSSG